VIGLFGPFFEGFGALAIPLLGVLVLFLIFVPASPVLLLVAFGLLSSSFPISVCCSGLSACTCFFQEDYVPGLTRTHQPVDGPGTYKVLLQSIASIFSCVLDMWSFCVHMVFSRKLLSWADTRPVDDKYNVEKSRCALLKRKRVKGLQE